jgi:hypothetical protein
MFAQPLGIRTSQSRAAEDGEAVAQPGVLRHQRVRRPPAAASAAASIAGGGSIAATAAGGGAGGEEAAVREVALRPGRDASHGRAQWTGRIGPGRAGPASVERCRLGSMGVGACEVRG